MFDIFRHSCIKDSCESNKRQVRLKGENLRMRAICRNNMADENHELVSQALNYILSSLRMQHKFPIANCVL